jgi:hypothetical protein
VIKLADKTSNLLAIAKSPPPWATDRKRAYVEWARGVMHDRVELDLPLTLSRKASWVRSSVLKWRSGGDSNF